MKLICTILLAMCSTLCVAQSDILELELELRPQSWGVIDSTGKFVVDERYRANCEFHNNISCAVTDDIWGLIDRQGNAIRPFKYSDIRYVGNGGWMLEERLHSINKQYTFIDSALNIVMPPTITNSAVAIYFTNGILCVGIYGNDSRHKYGYYKAGKAIVEPIYSYASPFNEGMAMVAINDIYRNRSYFWIDTLGNKLFGDYTYADDFDDNLALVGYSADGGIQYKWIDRRGNSVLGPYKDAKNFSGGIAAVMGDNGDWRFINRKGEFVGQAVYNSVTPFYFNNNKWWKVGIDNTPSKDGTTTQRYGVIDLLYQPLLMPVFGDIEIVGSLLKLRKGGQYALANSQLKLITPFEYDDFAIVTYSSGYVDYICPVQNGKIGLLTKQGDLLIKPIYNKLVHIYQSKMFYANIGGKWGVIFHTGRTFIPFIYDDIHPGNSNELLLYLKKDKIWYCFTHKGKFLYQSNWPPFDFYCEFEIVK